MTDRRMGEALWRKALAVAAGLVALVAMMPWAPDLATTYGQDDPNTIMQHVWFGSDLVYGRDLFFTHGPWSLWYQRHFWPSTYVVFIAAHLITTVALVASLVWAVTASPLPRPLQIVLLLLGIGLFVIDFDGRLFVLTALLPLLFDERRPWLTVGLAALAAFAALIKISLLVAALASIAAIGLFEIARLRRLPVSVVAFAVAYLLFYLAAGQDLRYALDLTLAGLDMSAAYGETMGHFGRPDHLPFSVSAPAAAFLVMAMAFGLAVIVIEWRRRGTFGLLFAFALALVLFAAFKAAFVRQDITHALHAFATLLPIAGLYAAARREEVGVFFAARPGLARGGVLATYGLVGMVGLGGAALAYRYPGLYVHKLGKFHRNVVAAVDALAGGDRLRREHDTTMAEIRRDWPIKVEGSVAVVGPKQIVAVANGLDLKALPTLNVYQAWSPSLAKRFAAFFETADRPRHLLIETGYYDGRPAWRAIRAQYRAVGRGGQRDHFEHAEAASPRKWSVVSENIRRVSWNTAFELPPLDVPSSETVVVEGKVEPTLLGRVIDLLYQRPYVNLEIERRDGAVASPRFGPIISSIGLAVSPWPLPDESIFAPPPAAVAKRAILKAGPDWSLFYKPEVELTIRRLRLVEAS